MRQFFLLLLLILSPVLVLGQSQQRSFAQLVHQDTVFYVSADQMPTPVGGPDAIAKNVQYPQTAKDDHVEGVVYVEVFLDEQGTILRTRLVKGVRADLNKAAMNALSGITFTPARVLGKPVKVRMAIPIRFRLNKSRAQQSETAVKKPTIEIIEGPSKLKDLIKYPPIAIRAGIQGEVFVTVVLDDRRNVSELKVVRGLGAGCENAVLTALANYGFSQDPSYRRTRELSVIVNFRLPSRK